MYESLLENVPMLKFLDVSTVTNCERFLLTIISDVWWDVLILLTCYPNIDLICIASHKLGSSFRVPSTLGWR